MSIGTVENFERAELVTFKQGEEYKTSRWANHSFTLITESLDGKASGIERSDTPGLGKVLTVGDRSKVRLSFKKSVTNLSWKQLLVTDYTLEDLQTEHPELVGHVDVSSLTQDNFTQFLSVFINDEVEPTPLDELGGKAIRHIDFQTTRAGSVQIDELRWNES